MSSTVSSTASCYRRTLVRLKRRGTGCDRLGGRRLQKNACAIEAPRLTVALCLMYSYRRTLVRLKRRVRGAFRSAGYGYRRTLVRLKRPPFRCLRPVECRYRRTLVRLKPNQEHALQQLFCLLQKNACAIEAAACSRRTWNYEPVTEERLCD